MDIARLKGFVDQNWNDAVVPALVDYIRIPNKSPHFDPDWQAHGHIDKAVALFERWARVSMAALPGASVEVVRLPGRTPVILIDIPGDRIETVLLYGHLDKQPEMVGWSEGRGPWSPALEGDKLFGRGGADDGYAMFSAITAILALRDQDLTHTRCVILIEACEESGSYDLPFYVDHLAAHIEKPSLVVCLDSGCGNYNQLWLTTSLRGLLNATLTVRVLNEGVHSGDASGVVPSSFRIARQLLSRLEDEATGEIRIAELQVEIPQERRQQASRAARALGDQVHAKFPFAPGTTPMAGDLTELVLNRTWRSQLAVIGAEGLPNPDQAGNVLLPSTSLKLSLRLPPTLDGDRAGDAVRALLVSEPPNGAAVEFDVDPVARGWNAPTLAPWLEQSLDRASRSSFGAAPAYMGEGGTIPFMAMLGARFPESQFVVTGVLGPQSNAHGPNEFLHIPTAKRITMVIAQVLADHFANGAGH
jgi:acetylornithine deacetylase/succinyl-diaminopimelate desuccinylase-like protein